MWRLVIQHVPDVREVITRLSDAGSAEALGGLAASSLPPLYDDDLSEEEEHAICGVYDMSAIDGTSDSVLLHMDPASECLSLS